MHGFIVILLAALVRCALGVHGHTVKGGPCRRDNRSCPSYCHFTRMNATDSDSQLNCWGSSASKSTTSTILHRPHLNFRNSASTTLPVSTNATSANADTSFAAARTMSTIASVGSPTSKNASGPLAHITVSTTDANEKSAASRGVNQDSQSAIHLATLGIFLAFWTLL